PPVHYSGKTPVGHARAVVVLAVIDVEHRSAADFKLAAKIGRHDQHYVDLASVEHGAVAARQNHDADDVAWLPRLPVAFEKRSIHVGGGISEPAPGSFRERRHSGNTARAGIDRRQAEPGPRQAWDIDSVCLALRQVFNAVNADDADLVESL